MHLAYRWSTSGTLGLAALTCVVGCAGGCGGAATEADSAAASVPRAEGRAPRTACEPSCDFAAHGRRYRVYALPVSFAQAEERCQLDGGHLATIEQPRAAEALRVELGSPLPSESVWIGLNETVPGRWRWVTGRLLETGSWIAGEPNDMNGEEHCAEWRVLERGWNDRPCSAALPYLCQPGTPDTRHFLGEPASGFSCDGTLWQVGSTQLCLVSTPRPWDEARAMCEKSGGILAVLPTPADTRALAEAMGARLAVKHAWVGLTDDGHEGRWTWTSGEAFHYVNWRPGEPNNMGGAENCVEWLLPDGAWNDVPCSLLRPAVCELDAKTVVVAGP